MPSNIRAVPDEYDTLIRLIVQYGAARFMAGRYTAEDDARFTAEKQNGDQLLDRIIRITTRLQRQVGGGQ